MTKSWRTQEAKRDTLSSVLYEVPYFNCARNVFVRTELQFRSYCAQGYRDTIEDE